jgi:prepilin peptidase CpaA
MVLVPLALIAWATWHDLRTREIPDSISIALLVWAVALVGLGWHPGGWRGLVSGAGLGLLLTLPWFYVGGIGGGDVKLLTGLGACLGPGPTLRVLLWTAVAGGLLALWARWRKQSDFAYVPAILAALLIEYTIH